MTGLPTDPAIIYGSSLPQISVSTFYICYLQCYTYLVQMCVRKNSISLIICLYSYCHDLIKSC